jgi:hypothetical protein
MNITKYYLDLSDDLEWLIKDHHGNRTVLVDYTKEEAIELIKKLNEED